VVRRSPVATRVGTALGAAVLLAVPLVGCSDDGGGDGTGGPTTGAELSEGRLTACLDAARAPFTAPRAGGGGPLRGLDVDVLAGVAEQLGLELDVRPTPEVALLADVEAARCDLAGGGLTAEVAGELATRPYAAAPLVLVVRSEDTWFLASVEDLLGRTLGVQAGSPAQRWALEAVQDDVRLLAFDSADAALEAVRARRADAAVVGRFEAGDLPTTTGLADLAAVTAVDEGAALVFAVASDVLRDRVDDALDELEGAGRLEELERRWAGPAPGRDGDG